MIREVVRKLFFGVEKAKPSLKYPYLFHLYHSLQLLRKMKEIAYEVAMVMLKHYPRIRTVLELEEAKEEDFERNSLDLEEIEEL